MLRGRLFSRRGGALPRKVFVSTVLAVSLLSPLVVLRGFLLHPLDRLPSPRPAPHDVDGDPLVAVGVLGRTWLRWDAGDFSRRDDRVFAPYPNVWPISESSTLIAAVGYPFYKATGSFAFGYDSAYYLACALTGLASGLFFRRLVGRGWPALLGTVLFLWCPGRLNNLGTIQTLWAGLNVFPLACLLRFRRSLAWSDALLGAGGFAAVSLGTLYGGLMGATVIALTAPVILWPLRRRAGPLLRLAAAWGIAGAFTVWFYAPLLAIGRDFEIRASLRNIEGHAADLLSVLHHGVFSGPLRDLCDRLVPGLPEGSSALFPTAFLVVATLLSLALLPRPEGPGRGSRQPERRLALWLLLALVLFSFALGPAPRLAGKVLGLPGPYGLLARLPAFSTMRGIHRWDQWFGLAAISGATLLAAGLLVRRRKAERPWLLAGLASLALLDVWPRYVPGQPEPGPSPFQRVLQRTGPDSVVGIYPIRHFLLERAWVEQLYHGRRLVNGFNSYPPPLHAWLDLLYKDAPPDAVLLVYRELGATAVEVHLAEVPAARRAAVETLLAQLARDGNTVLMSGDRRFVMFRDVLVPQLVAPSETGGLVFVAGTAVVKTSPGRLIFRLSGSELPVRVRTAGASRKDVLSFPLVAAERMTASLRTAPPPGAVVEREDGTVVGTAQP